jgi:hypothetical protein
MKELKEARMGMITILTVMLTSITRRLTGTKRLSSGVMMLMLAGVVLLVAAGGAIAEHACVANGGSGDAYLCGDTVMKSCTFNGTMVCTNTTEHGLIIGANNITINGANYTLRGVVTGTDCPSTMATITTW